MQMHEKNDKETMKNHSKITATETIEISLHNCMKFFHITMEVMVEITKLTMKVN